MVVLGVNGSVGPACLQTALQAGWRRRELDPPQINIQAHRGPYIEDFSPTRGQSPPPY